MDLFSGKHIAENTINGHWPGECDEWVKNNIDIIISKTENIYQWKKLDEHVTFQIIPPGVMRGKETTVFILIAAMKDIEKEFRWIIEKQLVFLHT